MHRGQLVAISGGTGGYWLRAFDEIQKSNEYKNRNVKDRKMQLTVCSIFNSTTFYWLWRKYSDCRHLTMADNDKLFIDLNSDILAKLENLSYDHQRILKATKEIRIGKMTYEQYRPNKTKSLIDEIDRVLAEHYGLKEEELDFIINYDIKYRMGLI